MQVTIANDEGVVIEVFTVHEERRAPLDPPPSRGARLVALLRDAIELAQLGLTSWDEQ